MKIYYKLLNVGKTKVAKVLRLIILLLYIAFIIWFPDMGYIIWFSLVGGIVCLVFANDGFKKNKLTGTLILTTIYGILWINAVPCVWKVLYPPQYKLRQPLQEKNNSTIYNILSKTKREKRILY